MNAATASALALTVVVGVVVDDDVLPVVVVAVVDAVAAGPGAPADILISPGTCTTSRTAPVLFEDISLSSMSAYLDPPRLMFAVCPLLMLSAVVCPSNIGMLLKYRYAADWVE